MVGGMKYELDLSISDRSGKIQNFHAAYEDLVEDMQDAMLQCAYETHALAFELCAVDTGFMREHLVVVTSNGLQTFEIGWRASDFESAGFVFYPVYVVLGTRHMAARDPLTPAYEITKGDYQERVSAAINQSLARRAIA